MIYTDTLQTCIMLVGSIILTVFGKPEFKLSPESAFPPGTPWLELRGDLPKALKDFSWVPGSCFQEGRTEPRSA